MSKTLAELRTGDPALVINTQQNNIFLAHVRRTDDTGVEVFLPEKNETQWYWLATGTADVEVDPEDEKIQATLIADPDDWRVKALMQRKTFKQLHRMVIDATNAFRKNPDAVNSLVLSRATEAWTIFVRSADPDAIRAENLLDYVERTA